MQTYLSSFLHTLTNLVIFQIVVYIFAEMLIFLADQH